MNISPFTYSALAVHIPSCCWLSSKGDNIPPSPPQGGNVVTKNQRVINFAKGASRTGSRSTAGEKKLANGSVEENEEIREYCQFIQLWQKCEPHRQKLCQSLRWKSDVLGLLGLFGRKRKGSEEERERFWWKKGVSRVGLAYRELIGILDDWYRKGI